MDAPDQAGPSGLAGVAGAERVRAAAGSGRPCRCPSRTAGITDQETRLRLPCRRRLSRHGCAMSCPTGMLHYYAGPGFYQALQKVAALTQLLPGSGTVQSMQDGAEAGQELEAGNYGKAAAHFGMGTVNAGLDWRPGGRFPGDSARYGSEDVSARTSENRRGDGGRRLPPPPQVVRATGLYRGKEGKWRFEASDAGYHVRPDVGALDQEGYRVAPLFEHHVHPALREAYPHFANITSRFENRPEPGYPSSSFNHRYEYGHRDGPRALRQPKELEIHELVHPIQQVPENFARPVPFMELLFAAGCVVQRGGTNLLSAGKRSGGAATLRSTCGGARSDDAPSRSRKRSTRREINRSFADRLLACAPHMSENPSGNWPVRAISSN